MGAIFTIFVGNPLGRRRTIFVGCVTMATGALLQSTAFHLPHLIIGRIITGWGNGMNTSTVPTWQSETAKSHDRGKLVMTEGMLITAGITLSYWINYGESNPRFPSSDKARVVLIIAKQALRGSEKMKCPGGSRWHSRFPLPL